MKNLKVGKSQLSIDDLYMNAAGSLLNVMNSEMYLYYANIQNFCTETIRCGNNVLYCAYNRVSFPFEVDYDSPGMEDSYEVFNIMSPYCFIFSLEDKRLISFNFLDDLSNLEVHYNHSPENILSGFDNIFSARFFKDISYLAVHYSRDTLITLDSYNKL